MMTIETLENSRDSRDSRDSRNCPCCAKIYVEETGACDGPKNYDWEDHHNVCDCWACTDCWFNLPHDEDGRYICMMCGEDLSDWINSYVRHYYSDEDDDEGNDELFLQTVTVAFPEPK